jgi:FkbM family methyltransferase
MIYKIFQNIKKILLKYNLSIHLLSKTYVLYNNIVREKKIKIWKDENYWIHETSNGLIPYLHPLFNPEKYAAENFEIFFTHYTPKKNDIILELGSGIGNETLFISKLIGDNGKIYCMEPFESIFKLLKKTTEINSLKNVQLINKALYNQSSYIGFSSEKDDWLGGKIDTKSKDKIATLTLNDFVKEYNIKYINFCKINIEGAEKYITENSNEFFKICDNLSIECHDFLEGNEYKTYETVKNFLVKKNYKIQNCKRIKNPSDEFFIFASK